MRAIVLQLLQGALKYGEEIADETFVIRQEVHAQAKINGANGQWENEEIELSGVIDMIVFPCSSPAFHCEFVCLSEGHTLYTQQTSFRLNEPCGRRRNPGGT